MGLFKILFYLFLLVAAIRLLRWFVVDAHKAHVLEACPADRPSKLRILQLNVNWIPPLLNGMRDAGNAERAFLTAKMSDNYDILCLQGAYQAWSPVVKDFIRNMQANGFEFIVTPPRPSFRHLTDSGLLIVSRYPTYWVDYRDNVLYGRIRTSAFETLHFFVTVGVPDGLFALAREWVTDRFPIIVCATNLPPSSIAKLSEIPNREVIDLAGKDDMDPDSDTSNIDEAIGSAVSGAVDHVLFLKTTGGEKLVKAATGVVNRFKVAPKPNSYNGYTHLSNHAGIEATLEFNDTSSYLE